MKKLLRHARRLRVRANMTRPVVAVVALALVLTAVAITLTFIHTTQPTVTAVIEVLRNVAVIIALVVSVATYRADSRNRRVDRGYTLHEQLTEGDIGEARSRLAGYLKSRKLQGRVSPVTQSELRSTACTQAYAAAGFSSTPARDATHLLRFFERVQAVQMQGAVDDLTLTTLVGRHACWWDLALADEPSNSGRYALMRLADHCNEFAAQLPDKLALLPWGSQRIEDFGRLRRADPEQPPSVDNRP